MSPRRHCDRVVYLVILQTLQKKRPESLRFCAAGGELLRAVAVEELRQTYRHCLTSDGDLIRVLLRMCDLDEMGVSGGL